MGIILEYVQRERCCGKVFQNTKKDIWLLVINAQKDEVVKRMVFIMVALLLRFNF